MDGGYLSYDHICMGATSYALDPPIHGRVLGGTPFLFSNSFRGEVVWKWRRDCLFDSQLVILILFGCKMNVNKEFT